MPLYSGLNKRTGQTFVYEYNGDPRDQDGVSRAAEAAWHAQQPVPEMKPGGPWAPGNPTSSAHIPGTAPAGVGPLRMQPATAANPPDKLLPGTVLAPRVSPQARQRIIAPAGTPSAGTWIHDDPRVTAMATGLPTVENILEQSTGVPAAQAVYRGLTAANRFLSTPFSQSLGFDAVPPPFGAHTQFPGSEEERVAGPDYYGGQSELTGRVLNQITPYHAIAAAATLPGMPTALTLPANALLAANSADTALDPSQSTFNRVVAGGSAALGGLASVKAASDLAPTLRNAAARVQAWRSSGTPPPPPAAPPGLLGPIAKAPGAMPTDPKAVAAELKRQADLARGWSQDARNMNVGAKVGADTTAATEIERLKKGLTPTTTVTDTIKAPGQAAVTRYAPAKPDDVMGDTAGPVNPRKNLTQQPAPAAEPAPTPDVGGGYKNLTPENVAQLRRQHYPDRVIKALDDAAGGQPQAAASPTAPPQRPQPVAAAAPPTPPVAPENAPAASQPRPAAEPPAPVSTLPPERQAFLDAIRRAQQRPGAENTASMGEFPIDTPPDMGVSDVTPPPRTPMPGTPAAVPEPPPDVLAASQARRAAATPPPTPEPAAPQLTPDQIQRALRGEVDSSGNPVADTATPEPAAAVHEPDTATPPDAGDPSASWASDELKAFMDRMNGVADKRAVEEASTRPPDAGTKALQDGIASLEARMADPNFRNLPAPERQMHHRLLGGMKKELTKPTPDPRKALEDHLSLMQRPLPTEPPAGSGGMGDETGAASLGLLTAPYTNPGARAGIGAVLGYNMGKDNEHPGSETDHRYSSAFAMALAAGMAAPRSMGGGPGFIPNTAIRRSYENLLGGAPIAAKALGDAAGVASAPIINFLQGNNTTAANLMRAYATPSTYSGAGRAAVDAFRNPHMVNELTGQLPGTFGRVFNGINAGAQHMLGAGGLSPEEQALYTFYGTPQTQYGKFLMKGQKLPGLNLLTPFIKVAVNSAEMGGALSPMRLLGPTWSGGLDKVLPVNPNAGLRGLRDLGLALPSTAAFFAGLGGYNPMSNPTSNALWGPVRFPMAVGSAIYDNAMFGKEGPADVARAVGDKVPFMSDILRSVEAPWRIPANIAGRSLPGFGLALGDRTVRKLGTRGHDLGINDTIQEHIPDRILGMSVPVPNRADLPVQPDFYGHPQQRDALGHIPPPIYQREPTAATLSEFGLLRRSQQGALPAPPDEQAVSRGMGRFFMDAMKREQGRPDMDSRMQSELQTLKGQMVEQRIKELHSSPAFAAMPHLARNAYSAAVMKQAEAEAIKKFEGLHPERSAFQGMTMPFGTTPGGGGQP